MKTIDLKLLAQKYGLTFDEIISTLTIEFGLTKKDIYTLSDSEIKQIIRKIRKNKSLNNQNRSKLQGIEIKGLFGKYNYKIDFDKAVSIFVSPNGTGKTTILNILVAIFNIDIKRLVSIKFDSITIYIKGEKEPIVISREESANLRDNKDAVQIISEIIDILPKGLEHKFLQSFFFETKIDYTLIDNVIESMILENNLTERLIELQAKLKYLQFPTWFDKMINLQSKLDSHIIFYPTYRRIESSVSKLFPNNNIKEALRNSEELVFGMSDVKYKIKDLLDQLKQDTNKAYVDMSSMIVKELIDSSNGNSISDLFLNIFDEIDMHKTEVILNRIGENQRDVILTVQNKLNSLKPDDQYDIKTIFLKYYLSKLSKIYDEQRILNQRLRKFVEVCSKYLSNKKIVYDEAALTVEILDNENSKISFEDLSSGEKQIISIFSKVYLELITPCIFIIDEPEISISIKWQRTILKDIYESKKVSLLIATTHSPFIFDNEYDDYTRGLESYLEE